MTDQKLHVEGIDWISLLDIVIKRKVLVLKVFGVGVIASVILSFILPQGYQATALLLVSPSRIDFTLDTKNLVLEASADPKAGSKEMFLKPTISLASHKILLQSGAVITKVITRLDLKKANGTPYSPDDVIAKIAVTQEKPSGLFQLFVKDKDPAFAMQLANVWADEYIKYTRDLISGEVKGTGDFVGEQYEIAKKNFLTAAQEIAKWKCQFPLDLMQEELKMKKAKLNSYKMDALNIEPAISSGENMLVELKSALAKQDKFIVTSAVAMDGAASQSEKKLKDQDQIKTNTEIVNPIYQDLQTKIVREETTLNVNKKRVAPLHALVAATQQDINELLKVLNEKQLEFDELARREVTYKKTYDNLSGKIEDSRITKAAQLGEVRLVSPAHLPDHPNGLSRFVFIILGGLLSLLAGIILAVFCEKVKGVLGASR